MLVKGVNDSPDELERIRETVLRIGPDKIQLNTVVRPGSEQGVRAVRFEELKKIAGYLGEGCEVITDMGRKGGSTRKKSLDETIVSMVKRHPLTISEISKVLGKKRGEIMVCVDRLLDQNLIEVNCYQGRKYCKVK
jgi:wyosine [tRNA(Phe)-imidazoG37] synthetase (radical SAM superfamily)